MASPAQPRDPAAHRGETVESALRELHPAWSRDHVAKLLRQGRVLCDGRPAARGQRLAGGERLEVLPGTGEIPRYPANRRIRLRILHADACIVVLSKSAGIPVHPGPGHGSDTLLNGLLARFGAELEELAGDRGWGLVQRLDRGASGVMVVARAPHAYDCLRAQFEARAVAKSYLALLAGDPEQEDWIVDSPVQGKDAESRFQVEERFGSCCLARVVPRTGRTHQIRWHAAAAGHPVVGDRRYGPDRPPDHPLRRIGLHRMFLHAEQISFDHPATLQQATYVAPLPRELRRPLERLRRHAGGPPPDREARKRASSSSSSRRRP